jgi:hypothetical protein
MGGIMLRTGILACTLSAVLLLAVTGSASAETAIERGDYLVNTIMACGNCHSPRDAEASSSQATHCRAG